MTSPRKLVANARNAARSTGPRSAAGKARSKLNAVAHGFRAVAPVLPGEDAAQWEAYRAAIVAELRACGTLETELANRVASVSWRLRRVAAYEVAAATQPEPPPTDPKLLRDLGIIVPKRRTFADAAGELRWAGQKVQLLTAAAAALSPLDAGDDFEGTAAMLLLRQASRFLPEDAPVPDADAAGFLAAVGMPEAYHDEPHAWPGWTAAAVAAGLKLIADAGGVTPEWLRRTASETVASEVVEWQRRAEALRIEVEALTLEAMRDEMRSRQYRTVPAAHALDAITRYEPHLSRQLADALDTLDRVQAARKSHEAG